MNMTDTKKCFRGVLLWREDVLKCAKCEQKPLSTFVRELLHTAMEKHRLNDDGNRILREQISYAFAKRETKRIARKRQGGGKSRSLMTDLIDIPSKVRRHPTFVKE